MPLTSVADGGQTPWLLSELRAAGLSAMKSASDHQCRYLCFHSPGTHQDTFKATQAHTVVSNFLLFFFKIEHEEHHKLKRLMTPNSLSYCGKKP